MKNSTYTRWSQTVSTVKKSTAMMLLACVRRNSRHDGPRRSVGPSPSTRRIFLTVVADNRYAEAFHLADDPMITPPRILAGKPHDQRSNVGGDRWSTRRTHVGPAF